MEGEAGKTRNHDKAADHKDGRTRFMKAHSFSLLSVLALLVLACSMGAWAEEEVLLPSSLQILGPEAFMNDHSVHHVTLPEGTLEIRERAFKDSGLASINLPDSLTFIADDAFEGIENVSMTANPGTYAYDWAVTHGFIIPVSPVTDFTFKKLSDATCEVSKYIGSDETVVVPATSPEGWQVTAIGESAFYGNTVINKVVIQEGVLEVKKDAFKGCKNLVEIRLPQSLKVIGRNAFFKGVNGTISSYCVYLPDNITSVWSDTYGSYYGYQGSFNSKYATLVCGSDTVTARTLSSEGYSFTCEGLFDFRFQVINDQLTVMQYVGSDTSVSIPAGVVIIGEEAFSGNKTLERVDIPEGVITVRPRHSVAVQTWTISVCPSP